MKTSGYLLAAVHLIRYFIIVVTDYLLHTNFFKKMGRR
jgi:hypothetical protein